jgi:hypothetical protein
MDQLAEFSQALEDAGGVERTSIDNGTLRVTYLAPHNYSTSRGEVRREFPEITQVDKDENGAGVTLIYELDQ